MLNWCVLLTPRGTGALAVVRLSGPGVQQFLDRHFDKPVAAGRVVHGKLTFAGVELDDPVIARPTETVIDINLHGSRFIVDTFLDVAQSAGFVLRQDEPLSAKTTDLDDVMAALPFAQSEAAVRCLLAQPALWELLRHNSTQALQKTLDDASGRWLTELPQVAIVGRPNVGKSTLANGLFAQARSITADVAGTTRDWVGAVADVDGLAVMLVDTPGQRMTPDAIESAAIAASKDVIAGAELVVVVTDASAESDRELIGRYPNAILVANKSDRGNGEGIATVATTGEGLPELRRQIRAFFGWESATPRAIWWTDRQRELLRGWISERDGFQG